MLQNQRTAEVENKWSNHLVWIRQYTWPSGLDSCHLTLGVLEVVWVNHPGFHKRDGYPINNIFFFFFGLRYLSQRCFSVSPTTTERV